MNINGVDSIADPTEVDGTITAINHVHSVKFHCKIADRKEAMKLGAMYNNYGADTPSGYWLDLVDNYNSDPSEMNISRRLSITRAEFDEIQQFLNNPMSFVVTSVFRGNPEEPVVARPVQNAIMELQILLD